MTFSISSKHQPVVILFAVLQHFVIRVCCLWLLIMLVRNPGDTFLKNMSLYYYHFYLSHTVIISSLFLFFLFAHTSYSPHLVFKPLLSLGFRQEVSAFFWVRKQMHALLLYIQFIYMQCAEKVWFLEVISVYRLLHHLIKMYKKKWQGTHCLSSASLADCYTALQSISVQRSVTAHLSV